MGGIGWRSEASGAGSACIFPPTRRLTGSCLSDRVRAEFEAEKSNAMCLDGTPLRSAPMNLYRIASVVCTSALIALLAAPVWAEGDAAAGKQKTWTCEGCHGIRDYRTAYPEVYSVPKLGGQSAGYIVKALQDYKAGARKNTTMGAIAAKLSDQDMADLAAYYAEAGSGK